MSRPVTSPKKKEGRRGGGRGRATDAKSILFRDAIWPFNSAEALSIYLMSMKSGVCEFRWSRDWLLVFEEGIGLLTLERSSTLEKSSTLKKSSTIFNRTDAPSARCCYLSESESESESFCWQWFSTSLDRPKSFRKIGQNWKPRHCTNMSACSVSLRTMDWENTIELVI